MSEMVDFGTIVQDVGVTSAMMMITLMEMTRLSNNKEVQQW